MGTETWIVYKAERFDLPGWEDRQLMPRGSFTDILWENWSYSGQLPKIGDRVREYENLTSHGNGVTHGKDGDWVVTRVLPFSSPETEQKVVICYCHYQPIEAQWEALKRGLPVDEMLSPLPAAK